MKTIQRLTVRFWTSPMWLRALIVGSSLMFVGVALAASVDQGMPGNQGPWKVDLATTATPLQTRVRDGNGTNLAEVTSTGLLEVTAANAIPTGLDWVYATLFDYTNCSSGGSANQSITAGTYMLVVLDEATTVCYASTCAANGRTLPVSSILVIKFPSNTTVSCRSAGSTGDLQYTKLQ